jgi:hypothetical protein
LCGLAARAHPLAKIRGTYQRKYGPNLDFRNRTQVSQLRNQDIPACLNARCVFGGRPFLSRGRAVWKQMSLPWHAGRADPCERGSCLTSRNVTPTLEICSGNLIFCRIVYQGGVLGIVGYKYIKGLVYPSREPCELGLWRASIRLGAGI